VGEAMAAAGQVSGDSLKELLDAFNQHDLDRIMEFFSDDATFDMPRGPEPWGTRFVGKDEVRKGLAARFSGIPDVHYGEDRHWVSGDRGVSEWLLTGTSTTGQKVRVQGCDLFRFRDGKVVRKDSYWKIVG
jgi:ketosteroid isomerase-like protein